SPRRDRSAAHRTSQDSQGERGGVYRSDAGRARLCRGGGETRRGSHAGRGHRILARATDRLLQASRAPGARRRFASARRQDRSLSASPDDRGTDHRRRGFESVMKRIAVLDDYQGVVLSLPYWSGLAGRATIDVYQNTLSDEGDLARRLRPYQI